MSLMAKKVQPLDLHGPGKPTAEHAGKQIAYRRLPRVFAPRQRAIFSLSLPPAGDPASPVYLTANQGDGDLPSQIAIPIVAVAITANDRSHGAQLFILDRRSP
jgi:hypothetical protein